MFELSTDACNIKKLNGGIYFLLEFGQFSQLLHPFVGNGNNPDIGIYCAKRIIGLIYLFFSYGFKKS